MKEVIEILEKTQSAYIYYTIVACMLVAYFDKFFEQPAKDKISKTYIKYSDSSYLRQSKNLIFKKILPKFTFFHRFFYSIILTGLSFGFFGINFSVFSFFIFIFDFLIIIIFLTSMKNILPSRSISSNIILILSSLIIVNILTISNNFDTNIYYAEALRSDRKELLKGKAIIAHVDGSPKLIIFPKDYNAPENIRQSFTPEFLARNTVSYRVLNENFCIESDTSIDAETFINKDNILGAKIEINNIICNKNQLTEEFFLFKFDPKELKKQNIVGAISIFFAVNTSLEESCFGKSRYLIYDHRAPFESRFRFYGIATSVCYQLADQTKSSHEQILLRDLLNELVRINLSFIEDHEQNQVGITNDKKIAMIFFAFIYFIFLFFAILSISIEFIRFSVVSTFINRYFGEDIIKTHVFRLISLFILFISIFIYLIFMNFMKFIGIIIDFIRFFI